MTTKQLTKLENRIATLKATGRIIWIEGISADTLKGKIAGKECHFVRSESLNVAGGSWYYIIRWESTGYECSCEYQGYKQCKHVPLVSQFNYARYRRKFSQQIEVVKAEAIEKATDLREYKQMVREAEEKAAIQEVQAEAKMTTFQAAMDAQYASDPRKESEEMARSYARMFYDGI